MLALSVNRVSRHSLHLHVVLGGSHSFLQILSIGHCAHSWGASTRKAGSNTGTSQLCQG